MAERNPNFDPDGGEFLKRSSYAHMAPSPEAIGAEPPAYLPEVTDPSRLIPLPDPKASLLGMPTCVG